MSENQSYPRVGKQPWPRVVEKDERTMAEEKFAGSLSDMGGPERLKAIKVKLATGQFSSPIEKEVLEEMLAVEKFTLNLLIEERGYRDGLGLGSENPKNRIEESDSKYERHRDVTLDRVILALQYMIPGFADAEATAQGAFIRFLTGLGGGTGASGNEGEKARQRSATIRLKDRDQPAAYKKDMEIIRRYAESLGMEAVVEQIDRDLAE